MSRQNNINNINTPRKTNKETHGFETLNGSGTVTGKLYGGCIESIYDAFTGASFDDERRDFIKNISSCDLLAVPGSGKTTALLAKLACVVQSNDNNDGILVLSHTNTAVDEIKNKLEGKFSVLFNYPNCVCTVQEFVDTFLAIPFYENINHSSVDYIDKDR